MAGLSDILSDISFTLRYKGAEGQKMSVLKRAVAMVLLEKSKTPRTFTVPFGPYRFGFRFAPLGKGKGARGIFLYRNRYEDLLEYGWRLLKPGDHAIDCGANQGIYSCAFSAAVGDTGRVIAIEPLPWYPEVIQANLDLNAFGQCEIIEAAASDRVGSATLTAGDRDVSASLVSGEGERTIHVKTVTLDDVVKDAGWTSVALIKLDIEGAELMALKGAAHILSEYRPAVCCEISRGTGDDIAEFFASRGYRPHYIDKEGFRPAGKIRANQGIFFLPEGHPHAIDAGPLPEAEGAA